MSLYCLGRYFQKYYPNAIWQHCLDVSHLYYTALANHAWLAGNNDHLFWYNTYFEPIVSYMLLSGDRRGLESGNLQKALRTQDILFAGKLPDVGLRTAPLSMLNKIAYLTDDGRWVFYRDRTELDTEVCRLGQSFWPGPELKARPPEELVGKWTIQEMPEPMWKARASGIPLGQSFLWGTWRTSLDGGGDLLFLDGFNGGGRNPYHTVAILEQRLNGTTAFDGYYNQVLTSGDGLVEPAVAMDGALLHTDVIGDTALAQFEVPKTPFCNWKRTIAQRSGRYALYVDELAFRIGSDNLEVRTTWSPKGGAWDAKANVLRLKGEGKTRPGEGWLQFRALDANYTSNLSLDEGTSKLTSIDIVLLKSTTLGDWVEMPFVLGKPVAGEVFADLLNYTDRGHVRLHLDGKPLVEEFKHVAPSALAVRASLGHHELAAGEHRLRVEVAAKQPNIEKCYVGFTGVSIRPDGVPVEASRTTLELHPSEAVPTTGGRVVTMAWTGEVKEGERRHAFYLLGQKSVGGDEDLACVQLAPNAAAMALPQPAIVVAGKCTIGADGTVGWGYVSPAPLLGGHVSPTRRSQGPETSPARRAAGDTYPQPTVCGELIVLASDHLFGRSATSAGLGALLLAADKPVDVDWDFDAGEAEVVVAEQAQVRLSVVSPDQLQLDGKPVNASAQNGMVTLALAAGRHTIQGAKLGDAVRDGLEQALNSLLDRATQQAADQASTARDTPELEAPEFASLGSADVGGRATDLVTMPADAGPLLCAAVGKTVHVLSTKGEPVQQLQVEGDIRVLRWWQEHKLLLVGCADEKVIAFDEAGNRKWEFTSVMDPAVYEAGKQYWFKSAYPGVHGLHTGVFMDGKSQAFVGSACTLEILDENGHLVKRMPVFWGNGWKFNLIDGPDGSVNLLIARWPNGNNTLAIINSKTLSNSRGYDSVPSGHSYVGGWTALNRVRTICEDLDGDGKKEVVSGTNGVWNRVTVYKDSAAALQNAQFGPGDKAPAVTLSDMDVCDLNGDGKKEIVVAKTTGLVVALDHQCKKVWSRRMPGAPRVLRCATPKGSDSPWTVVGCDDGSVLALDAEGTPVRLGTVSGRPTGLQIVEGEAPVAAVATDKGEVKCFAIRE